jgi:hypothetical protein
MMAKIPQEEKKKIIFHSARQRIMELRNCLKKIESADEKVLAPY